MARHDSEPKLQVHTRQIKAVDIQSALTVQQSMNIQITYMAKITEVG
jgi:hypothetical protein